MPELYTSIITDHSPFALPSRFPAPTCWGRLLFVKTFQLYGMIEHGHKNAPVWIYPEGAYPKDVNVVLTGISLHLLHLQERGELGETLYLQLDNTCAENKNSTMLGWASVIVSLGWVKCVVISFLPVGHTGEDIDSLWGRLTNFMNAADVLRPSEMIIHLNHSSGDGEDQITVQPHWLTDGIVDFRSWLSLMILPFSGITQVLIFFFLL